MSVNHPKAQCAKVNSWASIKLSSFYISSTNQHNHTQQKNHIEPMVCQNHSHHNVHEMIKRTNCIRCTVYLYYIVSFNSLINSTRRIKQFSTAWDDDRIYSFIFRREEIFSIGFSHRFHRFELFIVNMYCHFWLKW